jgi:hypothetical protein
MLLELERMLARAGSLVVVGYSFGEVHINELLRRRVKDETFMVRVVDPGFPPLLRGGFPARFAQGTAAGSIFARARRVLLHEGRELVLHVGAKEGWPKSSSR